MNETPENPPEPTGSFVDAGIPTYRVKADIAALTHKGSRANNEDAYVVYRLGRFMDCVSSNVAVGTLPNHIEDTGHLLIVGDGLGGAKAGEVASSMALQSLVDAISKQPKWALKFDDPATRDSEIDELITRSRAYLQHMHVAIRARQEQDPEFAGMGTTFTSAYTVGGDMFIMHVGDSRAYELRNGRLFRITRDHTVAQEYANMGKLPQSEVDQHPMSHVLTRALGSPTANIESDTHHRDIEDGTRLLLCSDGLTKVASEEDIARVLAENPVSADAAQALVDLALQRGAPDNVTVIVAAFAVK